MASVIENRIRTARNLLEAARAEYQRAQQEKGGAAVIALRNSCGKGWLAALESANTYFKKQGVAEEELPDTERGAAVFRPALYGAGDEKGLSVFVEDIPHRRLL